MFLFLQFVTRGQQIHIGVFSNYSTENPLFHCTDCRFHPNVLNMTHLGKCFMEILSVFFVLMQIFNYGEATNCYVVITLFLNSICMQTVILQVSYC